MTSPIEKFGEIEKRLDKRLDRFEQKLDDHAKASNEGFAGVHRRIDSMSKLQAVQGTQIARLEPLVTDNRSEINRLRERKKSPSPEGPASVRAAQAAERVSWGKLAAIFGGLLTAVTGLVGSCSVVMDRVADRLEQRIEHAERTTIETARESMTIVADTASAQAKASKAQATFDPEHAEEATRAAERAEKRARAARKKLEQMAPPSADAGSPDDS